MPFDFDSYNRKCAGMDPDALQREWEHYTRLISGAATSTGVSGMAIPFTFGVSTIGVAVAAPAIHNARKKRAIIERHLQRHGRQHVTRKRDVLSASAISGTVGVVTLGIGSMGADAIANSAAEHGISTIVENGFLVNATTELALDGVAVAGEKAHMHHKKEKEAWKAYAKAVKEGKNPALPDPHLKVPTVSVQPVMAETVPAISVSFPQEHIVPVAQEPVYVPVLSSQAGLQVDQTVQRRHSTISLSTDAPQPPTYTPQAIPGGYNMIGTTTAMSAPMVAGQTFALQYLDQPSIPPSYTDPATAKEVFYKQPSDLVPPALPTRPLSAMGVVKPPPIQTSYNPETNTLPQQALPASPPPPYGTQPEHSEPQLLQAQIQRPRGQSVSVVSSQPTYVAAAPPPPPPSSEAHRLITPNAYTPNYASISPLTHKRSFSCASPYDQKYSMAPEPPKYNPMNFVQPQY